MIRSKTYPLPASVKAVCVQDPCGDYDIVVNDMLSLPARLKAYNHELTHINNGDFERDSADKVEFERKEVPCK